MRSLSTRAIVERVADYYLASGDFNGYPIRQLARDFNLPEEELLSTAQKLVRRGRVTVLTSHAENPFIKRFPDAPKEKQLELLLASDLNRTCLYPSRSHLKRAVNRAKYKGRPFTLRLALGEPQLAYAVFDLAVLELYRNDPRYYYHSDDVSGRISIQSKHVKDLARPDQVLLESFGFAFNARLDRAVAVFLRYLSRFSPDHQQIWQSRDLARPDQVLLESFGFAFNARLDRAVAVFLRYLSRFSPDHQQIWQSRDL